MLLTAFGSLRFAKGFEACTDGLHGVQQCAEETFCLVMHLSPGFRA